MPERAEQTTQLLLTDGAHERRRRVPRFRPGMRAERRLRGNNHVCTRLLAGASLQRLLCSGWTSFNIGGRRWTSNCVYRFWLLSSAPRAVPLRKRPRRAAAWREWLLPVTVMGLAIPLTSPLSAAAQPASSPRLPRQTVVPQYVHMDCTAVRGMYVVCGMWYSFPITQSAIAIPL